METISIRYKKVLEDYKNPPIPKGYSYLEGEWYNGFVIIRNSDGSEFVWNPVGMLDDNGTLDGENYDQQFGRRNFRYNDFSSEEYDEPMNPELKEQYESVQKYGGFFISRYLLSEGKDAKIHSVKGVQPVINVNYNTAVKMAGSLEESEGVKSHLTYGAEYDSTLQWIIRSGSRTLKDILIGNPIFNKKQVMKTGSNKRNCVKNIYDFIGNADEFTQESYKRCYCVIRGGISWWCGNRSPVSYRYFFTQHKVPSKTGLRAVLCIK